MKTNELPILSPKRVKVRARTPVNQDATTVLIVCYVDGKSYYARSFEWQEYEGHEILDISEITFGGPTEVVWE